MENWKRSLELMRTGWQPSQPAVYLGTESYELWLATVIRLLPGWEADCKASIEKLGGELVARRLQEAILEQVELPIEVRLLGSLEFEVIAWTGCLNPRFIKRSGLQNTSEHLVWELYSQLGNSGYVDWANRVGVLWGALCWTELTDFRIASRRRTWRQLYLLGQPAARVEVEVRQKSQPVFYLHMKFEPGRLPQVDISGEVLRKLLGSLPVVVREDV